MAHMEKHRVTGEWFLRDDWHVEDVFNVRPDLNEEQAIDVLEALEDGFDANVGINWEVIEYTADKLYPELPETEED